MAEIRLFSASTFAQVHEGEPVANVYFRSNGIQLEVAHRVPVVARDATLYHGRRYNHTVRAPGQEAEGVLLTIAGDKPVLAAWSRDFSAFERSYGMTRSWRPFRTQRGELPGMLYLLRKLEDYTGLDGPL
ncbi:MAG TPA: hypothetical protein VJB16_00515, partial [archaeon]|nr:hypothetical protein [archaeon]